jgi:hypothetical protein
MAGPTTHPVCELYVAGWTLSEGYAI